MDLGKLLFRQQLNLLLGGQKEQEQKGWDILPELILLLGLRVPEAQGEQQRKGWDILIELNHYQPK
jgi:hypothetical protein